MRWGILSFIAFVCFAAPAAAQSAITLRADPAPVVEAEINGRPVRLEVDLRIPRGLILSAPAAQRLRVRQLPFMAINIGIEGSESSLRGRLARPRLLFDGEETARTFTGIFAAPVTTRGDGVIGPGALPYDVITIELNPEPAGARDIVLPVAEGDAWTAMVEVGGEQVRVQFDLVSSASVFNRTAARLFDAAGTIPAAGELTERPLILGLRTLMQPVSTDLTVAGLPVGAAFARTNAPLLGALEEDAVVVAADSGEAPPPIIALGRSSLSRCAYIRVDRRARTMTLRCAV